MESRDIPISDPTPDLSPTAKRLLDAAKQVLARDGFRALTFETIAREAGENPALIRYHFGSKAGLISVLVDAVLYLEAVELIDTLSAAPAGEERRAALFHMHRGMARDVVAYHQFYELIPNVLRDAELRPKLRDLMEWYRALDAWALAKHSSEREAAELQPLSLLSVAVLDGIALQVEADPELDVGSAFDVWERLVFAYLRDHDGGDGGG
jgi:AcrR family transcriptional regulator